MAVVLVVENEASHRKTLAIGLRRAGHRPVECALAKEATAAARAEVVDLALVDLRLDDGDGLEVLRALKAEQPELPVVLMTAYGSIELAVTALQQGAYDFLTKPFDTERLLACVDRALERTRLHAELRRRAPDEEALVGDGAAMQNVRKLLRASAGARTVLITGETGTGKELAARAVHAASGEPDAPFVVVHCGALPEALVESELFGHVRGAFSGAGVARRGLIAEAEGGTVFLDEVGEIPLALQPRLLRFLESGEIRAVGADAPRIVKCKVVTATHRDLQAEVKAGRLRQDLFFRLDAFRVVLPPLRERTEDLPALARHHVERIARHQRRPAPALADGALQAMQRYAWPGNIRELIHVLERAMLLCEGDLLPTELLVPASDEPGRTDAPQSLAAVERVHILAVLERCQQDRDQAASLLGISRSTMRRKLIEYGLWTPRATDSK